MVIANQSTPQRKYPKKHNHYGFRDFFHFDPAKLTLADESQQPVLRALQILSAAMGHHRYAWAHRLCMITA